MTGLDVQEILRIEEALGVRLDLAKPALSDALGQYWAWALKFHDGSRLLVHVWRDGPLRLRMQESRGAPFEARFDGYRWRGLNGMHGGPAAFRAKLREARIGWIADQLEARSDAEIDALAKEIPS